jgi:crotonobetainyl-CoA:carnitine CoA-transferase CaiB-like acyl-CoA transferase
VILDHRHLNRAKRTVLLDLTSEDGRRVLDGLLRDADVLIHSFSSGAAERLGLGYERLHALYPSLIYAEISAYGGPGPWRERRGYEPQAQAVSGIAGPRAPGEAPRRLSFALNDYGTGILTAYAIGLALLAREADGRGQRVSTSLAQTATLHQSVALAASGAEQHRGEAGGGEHARALQRLYRASDGWLFLGARPGEASRLADVEGLEALRSAAAGEREQALEGLFAGAPAATWVARLTQLGLGAQACVGVEELMRDPWVIAHGLSITRTHEDVGPVRTIGPSPRLSRTPARPGEAVRPPGADGPQILEAAGLGADVARLIEAQVLVTEGVTG